MIKLSDLSTEKSIKEEDKTYEQFYANITSTGTRMIITPDVKFRKGYIPQEGLKMYVQCPTCYRPHEITVGQCYIINPANKDNLNQCCVDNLEELYTSDIFKPTPVQYVYSNSKYCLHDNKDMDKNIDLYKSLGKVIGEVTIEHWNLQDSRLLGLNEFVKSDNDYKYIVNKDDSMALMYIAYYDIPLNRFYMIDDELDIEKLNSLGLVLKINC